MDKKFKTIKRWVTACVVLTLSLTPRSTWALPTGENVIAGAASISTSPGAMTINQSTDKAIIEYNSFSIAPHESVYFNQPSASSIALNRVIGADPSQILGSLSANGRVFLVNPNGVLFGAQAMVDTNGLIASTLDISNSDFLNGDYVFSGNGGGVKNLGYLNSPGGFIALLGSHVENLGWIEAHAGEVVLASGSAMTVGLDPSGIISVAVTGATSTNPSGAADAILNQGAILASEGGKVILSANVLNGLFDHAVNTQGIVEAENIGLTHGSVVLQASGADTLIDGTVIGGSVTSTNTTHDTIISGHIDSMHSDISVTSAGDIVHDYGSVIETQGGNFVGNAGQDYEVKNGSLIDAFNGTIDIYAGGNVLIGSLAETEDQYFYQWNYIGGERGGQFEEFGYYFNNGGVITRVVLASGFDIGRDGTTPSSGSGMISGIPAGLYGKYFALGEQDWSTDPSLNADGYDHYLEMGTVYFIEDQPHAYTDGDFQDVIVSFDLDPASLTSAPVIHTNGNMFITAQNGSIHESKSDISAGHLTLNAETGITGHGAQGGFVADVDTLSAYNGASGPLKFEDPDDFTIVDSSSLTGLNPGVQGLNGLTNGAVGAQTNLLVGNDLIVQAPVDVHGGLVMTAGHDIVQQGNGNIQIHQLIDDPLLPPVNLTSPSHTTGVASNPDHNVTLQWQLPGADVSAYDFVATAGHDFIQESGTKLLTHGGDANITADHDVHLALVNTHNGTANITAQNGNIIDQDGDVAPSDYDVIANTINLSAPNGSVGSTSPDEIDLGYPADGFSYVWNQSSSGTPDATIDSFIAFLNSSNTWVFQTVKTAPDNTTDWWFHVATVDANANVTSDVVDIGPFVFENNGTGSGNPPAGNLAPLAGNLLGQIEKNIPAYYEILDVNQYSAFEPIQPIGFYAYHPVTDADMTALQEINLEEGAFEFIDEQLKKKNQ